MKKDTKYYEDLAKNIDQEAILKNFMNKPLTEEEQKSVNMAKEIDETAAEIIAKKKGL